MQKCQPSKENKHGQCLMSRVKVKEAATLKKEERRENNE